MLPELVTPLTNRKTRKAVEQSFTSSVDTIDFEIKITTTGDNEEKVVRTDKWQW